MPPENLTDNWSWIEPVVYLVTSGGFGALVWYLITKHLPKLEERHREERAELVAKIEAKDTQHDEIVREFNETMRRSIQVQAENNNRLGGLEKSIEQLPSLIKEHTR